MFFSDFPAAPARRFGGIARLYGDAAFARLQAASVCIVGLGGVGSWTAEALARTGIGSLTLIDLDNVAESNINRQIHALSDTVGLPKPTALARRIALINPHCRVCEIEDFVTPENTADFFAAPFDFVVDAADNIPAKAAMAAHFVRHGQPFAVSGGAGGKRLPEKIRCADLRDTTHDKLLANLRYTLRRRYGFPRGTAKMRVPCVFSAENAAMPQNTQENAACAAPQGLSCAGYGAVTMVTAAFGLHLAALAVESIVQK